MRILLADDEKELVNALVAVLKHNNYAVDYVYNGQDAYDYGLCCNYDCIILDIMMPIMDGVETVKKLRDKGIDTPILLLTAKSEIEDRILGLDSGADDYLTKPFAMGELLARIRAMTRRKSTLTSNVMTFGNVTLNRESFELTSQSGSFRLAGKEFQMMEMLISNPNVLISVDKFMDRIWGYESEAEINVVWVYISNLRKKLKSIDANIRIKAVRGVGYTLEETDD